MKDLKFTYRWDVFCQLLLVFLWLLLVVSASSKIIPNAEFKVLAYLLAGLLGLVGTVTIFWIWSGPMKALKEAMKAANVPFRISSLEKRIEKLKSDIALYTEENAIDEEQDPPDAFISRKMKKLRKLRQKLEDLKMD
jgi:hypothetical protein